MGSNKNGDKVNRKLLKIEVTRDVESKTDLAEKYYRILFLINNIHVTRKELVILAYAGVFGEMDSYRSRNGVFKRLGSTAKSSTSISNSITALKKRGLLKRKYNTGSIRTEVADELKVDFSGDLNLNITLKNVNISDT